MYSNISRTEILIW